MIRGIKYVALFAGAFVLANCVPTPAPIETPRPTNIELPVTGPSQTSRDYRAYYARLQQQLLTHGQLRRDGGGTDTPITKRMLVDNFAEIALKTEYSFSNSAILNRRTNQPQSVTKYTKPVRAKMFFGANVSPKDKAKDQAEISRYLTRLSKLTGLPVGMTNGQANMLIYVLDADEIRQIDTTLKQVVPGMPKAAVDRIKALKRAEQCVVLPSTAVNRPNEIEISIVIVRAEQPDLMRLSCFHEEIAQGFGLGNDSPRARPTIFNDDNEFATLTSHDELLLRLLYDRRLAVGLKPADALAVVEVIAAEYFAGDS